MEARILNIFYSLFMILATRNTVSGGNEDFRNDVILSIVSMVLAYATELNSCFFFIGKKERSFLLYKSK